MPGGGFRHAEQDKGGPYLADNVEMAKALLALHRSTGEREWLDAGAGHRRLHRKDLHRSRDRRLHRFGFPRRASS